MNRQHRAKEGLWKSFRIINKIIADIIAGLQLEEKLNSLQVCGPVKEATYYDSNIGKYRRYAKYLRKSLFA